VCDTRQGAATGKNTNNEQQNYRVVTPFIKDSMVMKWHKDKCPEGSAQLNEEHPSSQRGVLELSALDK
jgi:hypothetical protein